MIAQIHPINKRKAIPSSVLRQVRQKCGFSCVICGCPVYHCDHIVDYSITRDHNPDNLALLCPNHHERKKKGLLTRETIKSAVQNIHKNSRTSAEPLSRENYTLSLGNNSIQSLSGTAFYISGFGEFKFQFQDGHSLINAYILDKFGVKAIDIQDSQITLHKKTWDIEWVGQTLTFRNKPRDIFAKLKIDPDNKLLTLHGNLKIGSNLTLKIKGDGIYLNRILLAKNNNINGSKLGLSITKEKIIFPAIFDNKFGPGTVIEESTLMNTSGIAILNKKNLSDLNFDHCDVALAWDKPFLKSLISKNKI